MFYLFHNIWLSTALAVAHEAAGQVQELFEAEEEAEEVELEAEVEAEVEELEAEGLRAVVVIQEVGADFEDEGSQSLTVLELHKRRRRFYDVLSWFLNPLLTFE